MNESTNKALLVPGTAALEPGIQEVYNQLEKRIQSGKPLQQFQQDDWRNLVRVAQLHTSALNQTPTDERRAFAKAIRQRSGWWGRPSEAKIADANLERTLIRSALDSAGLSEAATEAKRRLHGPGVFALRHARLPAFAYVGRDANQLIEALRRLLWLAFDGLESPSSDQRRLDESDAVVSAAILLTRQTDWQLTLVAADDSEAERQTLQNELTLRLGCLWPRGLNSSLNQSLVCLKELRELDWCRSTENGASRSHLAVVEEAATAMEARRLGLADLQFDDVRRIAFEADESGLYRCDEAVREFSRLCQQLRQRSSELHQADYDACHRLHAMAAELAAKPQTKERLKYRRDVRQHSGWWRSETGGLEFFDDSVANLDCLANTLARILQSEMSKPESGCNDMSNYSQLQTADRSRRCWRCVSRPCDDVLAEFRCLLHRSLDGFPSDENCDNASSGCLDCATAAMLLLSTADEWLFELHPEPDQLLAAELYNRLVLQLDALWPGGANLSLLIDWQTLPALHEAMAQRPQSQPQARNANVTCD
ncbi:hypothetical protein BOX15_Mlig022171g1 [Macrostomum lignano]|uniref:Uncharacterized protein n=1 Tax=Macrostomum lignano TaxID=282301 RepID=A0A267DS75_9PLAT|nr:hypothetical protein BOX15_Mlig022171g1 [Macrostomum lignano]